MGKRKRGKKALIGEQRKGVSLRVKWPYTDGIFRWRSGKIINVQRKKWRRNRVRQSDFKFCIQFEEGDVLWSRLEHLDWQMKGVENVAKQSETQITSDEVKRVPKPKTQKQNQEVKVGSDVRVGSAYASQMGTTHAHVELNKQL